jgi:ABC-2 type transport system permease protein
LTALALPALTVLAVSGLAFDPGVQLDARSFAVTAAIGFVLLYVVYYNLVVAYVARREELVLKRLRTGETTDWQILGATAVPAATIALLQILAMIVAGAVWLDLPVPVNGVLLVLAALAGIVLFVALAAVSTRFTRTVEMAQLSTMPVLLTCMLGSGVMVPYSAMPPQLVRVLELLPLSPVIELVRLGWLGTTGDAAPTGFVGTWPAALNAAVPLAAWLVLGVAGIRSWFRWEPRR